MPPPHEASPDAQAGSTLWPLLHFIALFLWPAFTFIVFVVTPVFFVCYQMISALIAV